MKKKEVGLMGKSVRSGDRGKMGGKRCRGRDREAEHVKKKTFGLHKVKRSWVANQDSDVGWI